MPVRIVFLGSKPIGFQCFLYLIQNKEVLNIEICGLCTQKRKEFDSENNLAALANIHNIPIFESLNNLPECEILYSVQYHEILKTTHLKQAKMIAVNLHLAPLPEYRGCNQFSFAIMDQATEFGVTIHEIDALIDHGDILFQKRFLIPEKCWVKNLYDLTISTAFQLFQDSIEAIIKGHYQRISQKSLVKKQGSVLHFRDEIIDLKKIDLSASKTDIEKRIRATAMPGFEAPYCFIENKKFYFKNQNEA